MDKASNTYPLLQSQLGVYIECMEHQGEIFYNIPFLYALDSSINILQLQQAVHQAFANHPNLFAQFDQDADGLPMTVAGNCTDFEIPVIETDDIEKAKSTMVVPFVLYGAPLFRVAIYKDSAHVYLFIDIHHAIYDGTSIDILLDEINRAYAGEVLPPEEQTVAQLALAEAEARQAMHHQPQLLTSISKLLTQHR